jgi:hypothetical protein
MKKHDRNKLRRDIEKLFNPEKLKNNLARASIFLACYELLKSSVLDGPKDLFLRGFKNGKDIMSEEYNTQVIQLYPKDLFHASCLWFKEQGVLSDEDVKIIDKIREHRNKIAHELIKIIMDSEHEVDIHLLDSIHYMVSKIDRWCVRTFGVLDPVNFEYVEVDNIPDEQIDSLKMLVMSMILKIVYGREHELTEFYRHFFDTNKGNYTS